METWAGSWITMGLIVLGLLVLAAFTVALACRALPVRTAAFYCPWARRNVVLRYLIGQDWSPFSLVSCTAHADPVGAPCGAQCLREGGPTDLAAADQAAGALPRS